MKKIFNISTKIFYSENASKTQNSQSQFEKTNILLKNINKNIKLENANIRNIIALDIIVEFLSTLLK